MLGSTTTFGRRPAVIFALVATLLLASMYVWQAQKPEWDTTAPVKDTRNVFRLALVTDLDHDSKDTSQAKPFWKSYFRQATLTRDVESGRYSVVFDAASSQRVLRSRLNLDGRGMELSWLAMFQGHLYSGDDRAGIVYDVGTRSSDAAAARFVLADGDGTAEKGFKSEWAAVKDDSLYIGSFGKEWTTDDGEFVNNNPMWIKIVDRSGGVTSVDWTRRYEALRKASGYTFPGYLFHESGAWNPTLQKWCFVPRRASKERYSPDLDETKGGNLLLLADADFSNIQARTINVAMPKDGVQPKGYSEIKFVPNQPTDIVALRSMEYQGVTKSWISVFDVEGNVLMDDVFVDDFKFEGLEFL